MKRKRKAATYILVIFMASVILITGTTLLTVVSQDVKTRVDESKQIQNLYGSDSNIDLVYSIIIKNSDMAVSYANCRAYENYKDYEDIDYGKLNKSFKEDFLYFLGTGVDGETVADANLNTLYYGIEQRKYMAYLAGIPEDTEEITRLKRGDKNNYSMKDISYRNDGEEKQMSEIKVTGYTVDKKNLRIIVEIESTFKNEEVLANNLENKRTISTKYIIKAPDYSDDIKRNDKNVDINTYQIQGGLYVDENLKVDNANLEVNGVSWVKGKDSVLDENSYYAYEKYANGIEINNGSFKANGNLSTNKSISLRNLSRLSSISGNVYAQNVYLGAGKNITSSEKESYKNNIVNVNNELITNNDLTIDAKDSEVNINDTYYGISDKNEKRNGNKELATRNSSSIIINTNDNSKVNIKNDAYLSGLAYIDFNADRSYYKTGESIAVIGNYMAYTKKVLSEASKDADYSFSSHEVMNYDNPLELIELADSEKDDTNFKADHFIEYYKGSDNVIKDGGISIGNKVYSTGASVYKNSDGNEMITRSSVEDLKLMTQNVYRKKSDYGNNVFNLGYTGDGNEIYDSVINDINLVKGLSSNVKTIKSQVNFDKLPKNNDFINFNSENTLNQKYGYSILDGDDKNKSTNVLVLEDGILKSSTPEGTAELLNLKSFDPSYREKVKAIIITKGDLVIRGNNDIYGCVIVGGNLYVEGNGKVTINYDKDVIENIMAHNSRIYDDIFYEDAYKTEINKTIKIGEMDNIIYSEDGWYDSNTYLRCGLWKLKSSNGNVINTNKEKSLDED